MASETNIDAQGQEFLRLAGKVRWNGLGGQETPVNPIRCVQLEYTAAFVTAGSQSPGSFAVMRAQALDQADVPPLEVPDRFRMEIVYFMTPPGEGGAPASLGNNEYWIRLEDARRWLDEMVVYVVSPLDAENQAEIELTEYHEAFLQWLVAHGVQHVRLA